MGEKRKKEKEKKKCKKGGFFAFFFLLFFLFYFFFFFYFFSFLLFFLGWGRVSGFFLSARMDGLGGWGKYRGGRLRGGVGLGWGS